MRLLPRLAGHAFYPILSGTCGVVVAMTIRLLALTALATGLLAAPAAAAPELQPLKPCYVSAGEAEERREGVVLRGTGFTPNAALDVYIDGVIVLSGTANVVGDLEATVKAPFQRAGEREFGVTVVERDTPVNAAGALSRVTALGVTLRPREARSSRRVRFRGRGFTAAAPVYAHYLYGGRVRKTVRLGRQPTTPCGTFNVRRRQIPIRRPRTGDWTLQIDQQRRYSAEPATNWVRLLIRLREVFVAPEDS
jgi:hypothetical protein